MLGAIPMASTWLIGVTPGSFTLRTFRENSTLCQVLGRPGGVHSLVGRQPTSGPGVGPAWETRDWSPLTRVVRWQYWRLGFLTDFTQVPGLDKSIQAAAQLGRSRAESPSDHLPARRCEWEWLSAGGGGRARRSPPGRGEERGQPTLEQHGFELRGPTFTRIVFQ